MSNDVLPWRLDFIGDAMSEGNGIRIEYDGEEASSSGGPYITFSRLLPSDDELDNAPKEEYITQTDDADELVEFFLNAARLCQQTLNRVRRQRET